MVVKAVWFIVSSKSVRKNPMSERKYKEVTLPAGTFRMYEDAPDVWVEAPRTDDYATWLEWAAANNPTRMKNQHN